MNFTIERDEVARYSKLSVLDLLDNLKVESLNVTDIFENSYIYSYLELIYRNYQFEYAEEKFIISKLEKLLGDNQKLHKLKNEYIGISFRLGELKNIRNRNENDVVLSKDGDDLKQKMINLAQQNATETSKINSSNQILSECISYVALRLSHILGLYLVLIIANPLFFIIMISSNTFFTYNSNDKGLFSAMIFLFDLILFVISISEFVHLIKKMNSTAKYFKVVN